jgi:ubiquinone/menaquinone biosynthesis C-methylase UbiE
MRKFISISTQEDGKSIWRGHFGVSPIYSIFDEEGNLIEQRKNPYAGGGKHHDDPDLIVNFLLDVKTFIAKNMGQKSRERLINKLGIESVLVDEDNIYDALNYYLEAKKNIDIFEECHEKYEEWFDKNKAVYESEIELLKQLIPQGKKGIEIGVGSGRFAYPLNIKEGVEPSQEMAKIAIKRGIKVYYGYAEKLPIKDAEYDFALIAVTICFVKDAVKSLKEINRILKLNGRIIVAIVDKNSAIGKEYLNKKAKGHFYKNVTFFSTDEVKDMLTKTGFKIEKISQTLFGDSIKSINEKQEPKDGYKEGGFVGIVGIKYA